MMVSCCVNCVKGLISSKGGTSLFSEMIRPHGGNADASLLGVSFHVCNPSFGYGRYILQLFNVRLALSGRLHGIAVYANLEERFLQFFRGIYESYFFSGEFSFISGFYGSLGGLSGRMHWLVSQRMHLSYTA